MATPNTSTRRAVVALAGVWLVIVVGCSDTTGLAKRYPVSGTVNYLGKPVEKGTITFTPTQADGRTASGTITNGSYSLTTAIPATARCPGRTK